MDDAEIYNHLCIYDPRNPLYQEFAAYLDDEELRSARANCACDNCFYGRNKLAVELLKERSINRNR